MSIPMQVIPGIIPAGYCPSSEQNRLNLYASLLSITFPLTAGTFNYGNTVPVPDQQSFPWIRTNSDGTPDGLYVYANGAWIRPHPVPPNSPIIFAYNGTLGSIATYDGGEVGSVSTADSGPMWAPATTDGNAPAGDGSNVIGYGQFLVGQSANFPQGSTGGEASHTMILSELVPHVHSPLTTGSFCIDGAPAGNGGLVAGSLVQIEDTTGYAGGTGTTPSIPGTATPFNITPPFLSVYYISRTNRVYYRA